MLENLNRIFGARFPPLVILGWLGAGIFLYTAFRSGEWRKKLTGMEGFLALLLLFMMANRIPNPAIISFRYVIGIGVLTLFWSVWLLRWSWHNCPAPLRRWRGMLLLALTFGICLGGFLKEIRLSKRTRRETEMIRFLQAEFLGKPKETRVWLTDDDRLERVLIAAQRSDFSQVIVSDDPEEWKTILTQIGAFNHKIYLGIEENDEKKQFLQSAYSVSSKHNWVTLYQKNNFLILQYTGNSEELTSPLPAWAAHPNHISENFQQTIEIPINGNRQLAELKLRGAGFLKGEKFHFIQDWLPNPGEGYAPADIGTMKLNLIPDGPEGNALFFEGAGMASVMCLKKLDPGKRYKGTILFRGSKSSRVGINIYLYSNGFLRGEQLFVFRGSGTEQILYFHFPIEKTVSEAEYFRVAISMKAGTVVLNRFTLVPDIPAEQ